MRRHAPHGIGDRAGDEPQAIIGPRTISPGREAVFDQRLIEKVSGEIAREGPPRAVGAIEARRQTNDQQPCVKRAKNRNRRIVPFGLRRLQRIAECGETRAKPAFWIGLVMRAPFAATPGP